MGERRRIDWGAEARALGRWATVAASAGLIAAAFVEVRHRQVLAGAAIRDAEERIARLRRRAEWHEIAALRLRERSALRVWLEERARAAGAEFVPVEGAVPLPEAAGQEEGR
jgi:hypothetical protein